ncbi:MAG: hypothetical protein WCY93_12195 [Anaerolineaceae bacterium]
MTNINLVAARARGMIRMLRSGHGVQPSPEQIAFVMERLLVELGYPPADAYEETRARRDNMSSPGDKGEYEI